MYNLWYSPSKNDVVAAILGPSDSYKGKLSITTKVDRTVKIPDDNFFLASDSSASIRNFKVKIMGVDPHKNKIYEEMYSKYNWSPDSMQNTSFIPVSEKSIVFDYSETEIEMFFGYKYYRFEKIFPNTELSIVLPRTLENFIISSDYQNDYTNLNAASIDFSKCEKIKVLDANFFGIDGKWTKITLPPNIEKMSDVSIYYSDFNGRSVKWNTTIIGIDRVKYFGKSAILYDIDQTNNFENVSYQLNPNAFYYSNSFPSWMSVEGGILVDDKNK